MQRIKSLTIAENIIDNVSPFNMEVPVSPELVTWILGWHTAIKVIKSESLVDEITQKLEEALKIYS